MEAGIAFSLTMAIVFAYYKRNSINYKKTVPIVGIIIGIIAAIISAILRSIPNLLNRTSLSFWSMVPVVISLVFILIISLLKKNLGEKKKKPYCIIYDASFLIYIISSFFYYLPALFGQLNSFVYYGESAVSTMVLHRIIGYCLGVLIIILSAIATYNNFIKIKDTKFDNIILAVLLIRGLTQFVVILQRLYSLSIIPRKSWIFSIISNVINNEHYIVFIIMLALIIIPFKLWADNIKIKEAYQNSAQLRKIKFGMIKNRRWAKFFLFLILINFLSLSVIKSYAGRDIVLSAPEEYQMEDGAIVIPLETLEDNHLHRYVYNASDGIEMRFFAIKKAENSYSAVLDACEICGPSGYFERNDDILCKLCDVVMNRGTIGFKGGCNPIPFPYVIHDKKIIIQTKDLDSLSHVFK